MRSQFPDHQIIAPHALALAVVVETEKWIQQRMAFFWSHDKITAVREFVQMAFALLYGAGRGHGSARFARRALSNARIPSIVDRGPPLWRDKP